jgi:DNA repair protein RecO (recombination protein O)
MYQNTKGIVISTIKYGETSIISKIYTENFGLQSYIVNGVRKRKGGSGYYQPLNILDLVVYHKNNSQLQRIKEVKNPMAFKSIPFHILKSSIALFIAEVLSKCLKEEEENPALFGFLESSIVEFDSSEFNSQYHIHFLVALSGYLGFYPNLENDHMPYFDLMNGCFSTTKIEHKHYIANSEDFLSAMRLKKVSNKKKILDDILEYYQLHLDGFKQIKSKDVLENVLNT